eukprot:363694-Chlamydomonas_euryale.AAC.19
MRIEWAGRQAGGSGTFFKPSEPKNGLRSPIRPRVGLRQQLSGRGSRRAGAAEPMKEAVRGWKAYATPACFFCVSVRAPHTATGGTS